MPTVLLAVGDEALGAILRGQLRAAGHGVVQVRRPLALLIEAGRLGWDLVIIDASVLGRDVLVVLPGLGERERSVVGVDIEDLRPSRCLTLDVDEQTPTRALDSLTA